MFSDSNRIRIADKKVDADVADADLKNRLFIRLVAKQRRFINTDFKYSIFDSCYLRKCVFDSCDFTGCRFVGSNLYGSSFPGSRFDYATFERTIVDDDLLETGCPGVENLKMRFARTLRVNYEQLGDSKSANKAIGVELDAMEVYLHKAWHSNEAYYRRKYRGLNRAKMWAEWISFKLLDLIWGNGESAWKLLRALAIFCVVIFCAGLLFGDRYRVGVGAALLRTPAILLGTVAPEYYPVWFLTLVVAVRLVAFGLFISILVKRLSRR